MSERELARLCGYSSVKSVGQGLRALRALGLVERAERNGSENAYHWLAVTDREREWPDTGAKTPPTAKPPHSAPPTHKHGQGAPKNLL